MFAIVENISEVCVPVDRGIERRQNQAVVVRDGYIRWVGPASAVPESEAQGAVRVDAGGHAVLPGLVDCHTHLVWGGDRIEDFSARARGESYAQIAARGGGILTTVTKTSETPFDALVSETRRKIVRRRSYGVTTTEIKSGYGLTPALELRMLSVIEVLRREGFDLEPTLLGAHALPRGRDRAAYVESVVNEMIPMAAERKLARFVDVFVESHAFTVDEARDIFRAGKRHGMIPRIHADQLSGGGGAELAAEVGAASADHLEHVSDEGLRRMAEAGVVATLLPGALLFLGQDAAKLGRRVADAGVAFAVATDANPGSSPLLSLPLAATFATTQLGLSVEESLFGITKGAALALRRTDIGVIEPGARARLLVLNHSDGRALVYAYGEPVVEALIDEHGVDRFEQRS
ncbi:MAG: imidazolonepropionase [Deltaproteobacteria bacterium]|nr:imidazolonepropionase [Deltaproteobacteria bacterium]